VEKSIQYLLPRLQAAMTEASIDTSLPVVIKGQWIDNPPRSFFAKKFIVTAAQADKIVSLDMAQSGEYYLKKIVKALRVSGIIVTK
jgi:hypothetical protein